MFDNICEMDILGGLLQQHKNEFDRGYLAIMFNFPKSIVTKLYMHAFEKLKTAQHDNYMIIYNK